MEQFSGWVSALQFGGRGRKERRNWSISFIWPIWSVRFGETRTGLSGLFGLSRSFGWLIGNQMNQTNQEKMEGGATCGVSKLNLDLSLGLPNHMAVMDENESPVKAH